MTQLMLFDTPATESFAPIVSNSEPKQMVVDRSTPLATQASQPHQRGLNHMGDLARLVLLRYDLVAQRRARRLAREAANA